MRSVSSPRAVSIRIGRSERARTWRQSSKPSASGSITSRTSASQPPAASRRSPSPPLPATLTRRPKRARYSATSAARLASSSIIRTCSVMRGRHSDACARARFDSSARRQPQRRSRPGARRRSGYEEEKEGHRSSFVSGASRSAAELLGQLHQLGTLLRRQHISHVGQGLDDAGGSRFRQLKLGLAQLFERLAVYGGLRQRRQERVAMLL